MKKLVHGGDLLSYEEQFDRKPLDFSANINPLGIPKKVLAAAKVSLKDSNVYPDPLCRNLTTAIAVSERLPCSQIICGNGAADLIFRLALAVKPKLALIPVPTFAEYEKALASVDCRTEHHLLTAENGFILTESILPRLTSELDILILCNPNNPTGQTVEPDLLLRIAEICKQNEILLVLDECFNSFLDDSEQHTMKNELNRYLNIFILQAFTKLYAMPGLRLGYGLCADESLMDRLFDVSQSWAVSNVATAAGIAALEQVTYVEKSKKLIQEQRAYLKKQLNGLNCEVIGSHANFIFFHTEEEQLEEKLKEKGILIRSCDNYIGLDNHYDRIAVRRKEDNQILIKALRSIMKKE
jgi:threonine-phosphate decarboxylase